MGCSVQKEIDCCEMEKRQCDEFYPYHNCPNPAAGYWSRDYKRHVRQNWSYEGYYPNTQTIYYVPVEDWAAPPVNNRPTLSNTPRPERLGEYRDNGKTDAYGNRLQPNQYPTRGASGQRGVGDVTRPNAPKTTRN